MCLVDNFPKFQKKIAKRNDLMVGSVIFLVVNFRKFLKKIVTLRQNGNVKAP